jgi:hypothetical protein
LETQTDINRLPHLVFLNSESQGWGPIEHLAVLAARLLELNLTHVAPPKIPFTSKIWNEIRSVKRGVASGAIYLVKSPGDIRNLAGLEDFSKPRQFRALWIVDSFWTDWAPSRWFMRQFDIVVYMQKGEADFYERLAPGRALYLGWGADVLDLGSASKERPVDILRVGRQPEAWDDDFRSASACAGMGLLFAGRPPFFSNDLGDPSSGHRALCTRYAQAKYVLAHSNLAAPAKYTHPTKEYITGRWTDALAAGAIVAGVQPFGDISTEDLLWPGATLAFDRVDLKHNLIALQNAVALWTPSDAIRNFSKALIHLDWRWRLETLAKALGLECPVLESDLVRLKEKISTIT